MLKQTMKEFIRCDILNGMLLNPSHSSDIGAITHTTVSLMLRTLSYWPIIFDSNTVTPRQVFTIMKLNEHGIFLFYSPSGTVNEELTEFLKQVTQNSNHERVSFGGATIDFHGKVIIIANAQIDKELASQLYLV